MAQSDSSSSRWVYTCISVWFAITAPIMIMDALYCLLRPRTMIGGDLHWAFGLYEVYQEVDYVYGVKAFENGEGFADAAAILNLLEIFANLLYLLTTHVLPHPCSPLLGYSSALMTLSKTILYVTQEYFCGWCATGHNTLLKAAFFWYMPNCVWVLLSSLTIYVLGNDIISSLRVTSPSTSISSSSSRTPGSSSHEARLKVNSETASQTQSQSWAGAGSATGGGGAGKTLKVH